MYKHLTEQTALFASVFKWVFLSSLIGIIIGALITEFLRIIQYAEHYQLLLKFPYYYTLPFTLVITVWLVKTFAPSAKGHGTEKVIEAVHKKNGKIDVKVIPVKLIATVLTIFSGGSVGKEGPGAQIGAGTASLFADIFRFNDKDRKKFVICGISAGFAAVFGTPIAGVIFGVEVLIIGSILYEVLLPSFIAGFAAFTTARFLGINYTYYDVHFYQSFALNLPLIIKVITAGIFFGLVANLMISIIKEIERGIEKLNRKINHYIVTFLGGALLVGLTFIFSTNYLGLGLDTIQNCLYPDPYFARDLPWYAFLVKTVFTGITLGVGGSGGIITPVFFVGATSGHLFGLIAHADNLSLFAALGFVSVLAGATNAPIAAIVMAVELFGIDIAHYAAISAVISFLITGHRSVFPSQILALKKSDLLDVEIGKEVEKAKIKEPKIFSRISKTSDIKKKCKLIKRWRADQRKLKERREKERRKQERRKRQISLK